ncbi:SDR family oxidoreductase [Candidatus Bipolaricaulota bacterium]
MAERVLVTGGAGFIGSNLVTSLLEEGRDVRVLDDFSTGHRENLIKVASEIELIEGDIRDLAAVQRAMGGVDVVFHQAALASVPRSVKDPIASNEVNVTGTLNILVAAKEAGARRVVYAASSSAYGENPELPKHEGMTPDPLSPYAVSKFAAEQYCRVFYRVYGLETVALRYFNVFGPRQDPNSQYSAVIPLFIGWLQRGEAPRIEGDGEQTRDFTFIENVVRANLLAAETPNVGGEVFNVACNERISINELAAKLAQLIRPDAPIAPIHGEARPGDVKHSLACIDKARQLLGYEPAVGFEEGLKRTVEWFQEQG